MHHRHQVPQHPEHEPGAGEGGREEEELVAPLHVQEGGPEVAEVQRPQSVHVLDADVAPSVFRQHAAPPPEGAVAPGVLPGAIGSTGTSVDARGSKERLRDVGLRLRVANLLRGRALGGGRGR